jgi:DNA-binding transcriptional LysR family regulator
MELRHIRYFLAVAEELNFTRAAARVGIGQPPLSQQIRALESELGVSLFRRLAHGAELTEVGLAFLPEARAIIAQSERATLIARRAARGETGLLRIGFTSSSMFHPAGPTMIRDLRRRHPDVLIELQEGTSHRLAERLEAKELDAAFVRPSPTFPESLRVQELEREPFMVALPSSHRLARNRAVSLGELSTDPFVLSSRSAGTNFPALITKACHEAGFEPTIGHEAHQISSIVNLVAAELGVALVPASIAQIKVQGVVYLEIDGARPTISIVLATRWDDPSVVVRSFVFGDVAANANEGSKPPPRQT